MFPEYEAKLQEIRKSILESKKVATVLGFGPRFLHSTGQAYKGGPNSGVFVQITCDDAEDLPVPQQKYTFGIVKAAQARGDFQVLADRKRRALRVHLGKDLAAGLDHLHDLVCAAVAQCRLEIADSAQQRPPHAVVFRLLENQVRALACRTDIFAQVQQIDVSQMRRAVERASSSLSRGIAVKVGCLVLENGLAQAQESLDIPAFDGRLVRVQVNGKIEKVRHEKPRAVAPSIGRLQHVQSFEDQNVGLLHALLRSGHDVVMQVGIDRAAHFPHARFDIGEEAQQQSLIVAFRKSFALHEPARFERGIGMQKAVGCDQRHFAVVRPARERSAQHARKRAFADRDATRDADDVRNLQRRGRPHEFAPRLVQVLYRRHVQIQQPRQRHVNIRHFAKRDLLVDAAQGRQVFFVQQQRRIGA